MENRQGKRGTKWQLAELLDFEMALASRGDVASGQVETSGLPRNAVLHRWLTAQKPSRIGERLIGSIRGVGILLAIFMGMLGFGLSWGLLDRHLEPMGLNVLWFLGFGLGLPWLIMLLGLLLWLLRGRIIGGGWGTVIVRKISLRTLPKQAQEVLHRVLNRSELAQVLGWHIGRWSQWAAACFPLGAMLGLLAMVLFKRVGFFWETTTRVAMREFLEIVVQWLALPWSWLWPGAVPDVAASELGDNWAQAGLAWWPFCFFALLFWGVVPRLVLAEWARYRERKVCRNLKFDSVEARKLFRELTQTQLSMDPETPADGALVIALGALPDRERLRPFLLQRLRMNPTSWEQLGVLDEEQEQAAKRALEQAPEGIVIIAEGWALAPRKLHNVMQEIVQLSADKKDRRLAILVTGSSDSALREQWEKVIDEYQGGGRGSWELWFTEFETEK